MTKRAANQHVFNDISADESEDDLTPRGPRSNVHLIKEGNFTETEEDPDQEIKAVPFNKNVMKNKLVSGS